MNLRVHSRNYPANVVKRIIEKQMRLTAEDAELYDNAQRVVGMALDIAERYTGRQIADSRVEAALSALRTVVDIPIVPVSSIVSVEFIGEDDQRAILAPSD